MLTLNNILKEIKDIPVNRLEEVYEFVHSLTPKTRPADSMRKKILSYGGAFSDMSKKDYAAYAAHTKKTRNKLFDRNIEI
jgi:hypothetical protein